MTPLAERLREELTEEAADLASRLGHPLLELPGAVGVLNPHARANISIFGPRVDQGALVSAIGATAMRPQLNVLEGVEVDEVDLARCGWRRRCTCTHMVAPSAALAAAVPAERVDEARLSEAVALMNVAFNVNDSDEVLPVGVTAVPGLALFLDRAPSGQASGLVGVRLRRRGAMVFGLGVLPVHRRSGTGRRLVSAAAAWALDNGRDELHLQAEEASLPFWAALGFASRGRWTAFEPVA